jgi:hypothetical protein
MAGRFRFGCRGSCCSKSSREAVLFTRRDISRCRSQPQAGGLTLLNGGQNFLALVSFSPPSGCCPSLGESGRRSPWLSPLAGDELQGLLLGKSPDAGDDRRQLALPRRTGAENMGACALMPSSGEPGAPGSILDRLMSARDKGRAFLSFFSGRLLLPNLAACWPSWMWQDCLALRRVCWFWYQRIYTRHFVFGNSNRGCSRANPETEPCGSLSTTVSTNAGHPNSPASFGSIDAKSNGLSRARPGRISGDTAVAILPARSAEHGLLDGDPLRNQLASRPRRLHSCLANRSTHFLVSQVPDTPPCHDQRTQAGRPGRPCYVPH